MKSIIKKISCLILAGILCTACACGTTPTEESKKEPTETKAPNYTKDEYNFTTVFFDGEEKVLEKFEETTAHEDGAIVYDVYSSIGDKNYLKLDIETDVDLVGFINYYNVDDQEETNSEKFFIKAGSTQFTTFLDAFRVGARGDFKKVITTISFQGVDETKEGHFTFNSLGISDRTIVTKEDWYISNGDMLLGTSPFYGGCITHLEKLDQDVYEYMDGDGNIVIDRYVDPDFVDHVVSDRVNLVNIYDLGREIQPSYYSRVAEVHGYTPDYDPEDKDSYYQGLGGGVLYNPIQCGDYGEHTPQIIDYVWKENYLYVIMKAQEWFFYTNIQANGYIEVTYYFDEGGALMVDNVYTDFSCFIGEWDVQLNSQETPATYFVYPFNKFYCDTKQGLIEDTNLAEQNGTNQPKATLHSVVSSKDYFYAIKGKNMKQDWCAFVNDSYFGVGIFMPNADEYVASRGRKSNNYYSEEQNRLYKDIYFDFGESEITPSYAAMNYNYINPSLHRKMVDYVPLKYSYALFVGDTDEMGSVFGRLADEKILTNDHLTDTTQGWPAKN